MELAFADLALRALCLNESIAKQELGGEVAEKLKRRLADIAAASVVAELLMLPGKPTEISHQPEQMAIELVDGWLLLFSSGHTKERTLPDGSTDWGRVRRIKVLKVEKR